MKRFRLILLTTVICLVSIVPIYTLAQVETRKIPIIIIDPGFGGEVTGPASCKKGVYAKDVNLQIAIKLAKKIENKFKIKTILTRNVDQSLSLEERVTMANNVQEGFFISIHSNAHKNPTVKGIETYYMKVISEEVSISWPKKDDSNLSRKSKEAEIFIKSMINDFSSNLVQSEKLALLVQESIIHTLKRQYPNINNRGIKSAPFYIFLGNIMPTILIETGFVSNPMECERLLSEQYQEILCDGIIEGIENFINR